jgi:hypothetical protein
MNIATGCKIRRCSLGDHEIGVFANLCLNEGILSVLTKVTIQCVAAPQAKILFSLLNEKKSTLKSLLVTLKFKTIIIRMISCFNFNDVFCVLICF